MAAGGAAPSHPSSGEAPEQPSLRISVACNIFRQKQGSGNTVREAGHAAAMRHLMGRMDLGKVGSLGLRSSRSPG